MDLSRFLPQHFQVIGGRELELLIVEIEKAHNTALNVSGHFNSYYSCPTGDSRGWRFQDKPYEGHKLYTVQELREHIFASQTRAGKPVIDPKPGDRVVRGKDWEWHDQDGGIGGKGTVIEVKEGSTGWVRVRWDKHGNINAYRYLTSQDLAYAPEIIKYIAPSDLYAGKIKEGDVVEELEPGVFGVKGVDAFVPAELVKTWQPVIEKPKVAVVQIGKKNRPVTITKDSITAADEKVNIDEIRAVISPTCSNWSVKVVDATYNIGCTEGVTHEQLVEIVKAYDSLQ